MKFRIRQLLITTSVQMTSVLNLQRYGLQNEKYIGQRKTQIIQLNQHPMLAKSKDSTSNSYQCF